MKASYKDLYKKRNQETGIISTVFRYLLSGKEEDLKRYRAILEDQGIPVHTDEKSGSLIYFDTVYHGAVCAVEITERDKIIVPDNQLDFLQSQLRLATDPSVKQALAQAIAQFMVQKITGGAPAPVAGAPVAQAPVEESAPEDADLNE